MTNDYNFVLSAKDFNKKNAKYPNDAPMTSTGQLYDLLSVAVTGEDYNDLDTFDAYDAALDYVMEEYDYERGYIVTLNAASDDYTKIKSLTGNDDALAYFQQAKIDGLLFGAWYALNKPDAFEESLKDWKSTVEDARRDFLGDFIGREGLPVDLAKELEDAYEAAGDDTCQHYLHGDGGRNWSGVYTEAERALFRDYDIDLYQSDEDRKHNRLNVKIDEANGRQLVEDWNSTEPTKRRIGVERVKLAVIDKILNAADNQTSQRKRESEKRKANYESTRQYQAEQATKAEAERTARLLSMKRA